MQGDIYSEGDGTLHGRLRSLRWPFRGRVYFAGVVP